MTVLDWLLDSDPAVRYQVLRDLVHAPAEEVAAERSGIANEGWGARLLALQGEDGTWAGGACFPGVFDWHTLADDNQPWTSTLPVLKLLQTPLVPSPPRPLCRRRPPRGVACVSAGFQEEVLTILDRDQAA